MVDAEGRVVVYMQNRRDHPDPAQPPIDFPGMTVLQYAGDGKFSLEEDFWSLPRASRPPKRSAAAYRDVDPDFPKRAPGATGATARRGRRVHPPTPRAGRVSPR